MSESPTRWHALPAQFRALASLSPHAILLETSRFDDVNHASHLFLEPRQIIRASSLDEIPDVFRRIEKALGEGSHVAGYLAYEAGFHFVDMRLQESAPWQEAASSAPLAWFGVYPQPFTFDHRTGDVQGKGVWPAAEPGGARSEEPLDTWDASTAAIKLGLSAAGYTAKIHEIQALIAQGDTYQVNFTDEVSFATTAPAALYASLVTQQAVSYAAYLNLADQQILSFSPELFFRIRDGMIDTKPMKGTAPRGLDADEDVVQAERLRQDDKNRAEHVMIVDLLRNDLGRLCQAGSVQVADPYAIERFQTLHQMTSTVSGRLRPGLTFYEIFASLFPCGSITGAPKIRTMGIIRDLERRARGAYTGAIGFIAPNGGATFSVAIRTLEVAHGQARMGVGGGIVADSNPREEYEECLLKTSFLTRRREDFELFETLKWQENYHLLSFHLERLKSSARYFGFPCDGDEVLRQLRDFARTLTVGQVHRVRLTLGATGRATLRSWAFVVHPSRPRVRVARERTDSRDVFRRHKTTLRGIYDRHYAQALEDGFDEVLFLNERGEVTEGAISNLFVAKNDRWFTPPLHSGVLPGVFRRHVLETRPNVEERILRLEDLEAADGLYVCNSLRGLRRVHLVTNQDGVAPGEASV